MFHVGPVHSSYAARGVPARWLLFPLLLALALLAGCATPPVTTPVSLTLEAAPDVNPDAQGRASPVAVRFYALKAPGGFESADYFSLQDRDTETLGADMVLRKELVLSPGQQQDFQFELDADVSAMGFTGGYRDLNHARWRQVLPLSTGKPLAATVRFESDGITVQAR